MESGGNPERARRREVQNFFRLLLFAAKEDKSLGINPEKAQTDALQSEYFFNVGKSLFSGKSISRKLASAESTEKTKKYFKEKQNNEQKKN